MIDPGLRIGVVGASGAVGRVTLQLLLDRGYTDIRAFASWRSAGERLGDFEIEEATAVVLGAGDLDLCFFSIGTQWSRQLVPPAAAAGAVCVDKSAAFRLSMAYRSSFPRSTANGPSSTPESWPTRTAAQFR